MAWRRRWSPSSVRAGKSATMIATHRRAAQLLPLLIFLPVELNHHTTATGEVKDNLVQMQA